MAITANGIGSGLDINSLVSQLMTLEQRPLTNMAKKEASYQAKLSAFGQVKSVLSAFQTSLTALKDAAKFTATRATVGSDAGFTASSASTAAASSYAVKVEQLATTQRVATSATTTFVPAVPDPADPPVPNALTINFGTYTAGPPAGFAADADRKVTLDFTGSTIEDLRDAINADSTLGIKASLVDNGTAKQLVFTGTGTGAEKAFSLSGTGSLAALQYSPDATTTSSDTVYNLQSAQDAIVDIDGIQISRGSNTVNDAIEGVTLSLTKETSTAANLTIADDRSQAKGAIDSFIKAYNETLSTLKNLTGYDAEKGTSSTLTGDATARGIQNQLRNLVGSALGGLGNTTRLSEIGITFQRDGALKADSTKLDAALADPARNVAEFFAGKDDVKGFADTLSTRLDDLLGTSGMLNSRTDGINASIKALDKQRENLLTRLESVEKRYRAQFTALDTMIASMSQTSTYLTQQLANLPKIG